MNSRIGRLYPTTKFIIMLLVVMISIFTDGYALQYLFFPIFLVISCMAGTGKQFLGTFLKSVFIIVIFIFVIQVFIITNDDQVPIWAFIHFSQMGLDTSLVMTSKIVAISSAIMCFFQVTKVKDIIYALEKAGVPRKVTFLIASTIQLIPQMTSLQRTIADAQKSRGIETEGGLLTRIRAFVPMLGPLVLSSIQQTEERVLALESRAFSAKDKKTSIYYLDKSILNKILELMSVAAIIVYIVWRFL